MALKLTKAAEGDLLDIYLYGLVTFGERKAESYHVGLKRSFEFIDVYPEAERLRDELAPPVRIHRYGAHIIIYTADATDVLVIRVRHGCEDWASDPVGDLA